jgi:hypothetical protein
MDIQATTNEELRTKLVTYFKRKNSLWVQIEKLAAGLVIANENFLFKIKKKETCRINHRQQRTYFSK